MNDLYQGDPKIIVTADGASIKYVGGQPRMDHGLENQAFISLFTDGAWLGNDIFDVTQEQVGSDFEDATRQPITLRALNDIRDAAVRALAAPVFGTVTVTVENPLNYRLNITILIEPPGQDALFLTLEKNGQNWLAQATNPAYRRI